MIAHIKKSRATGAITLPTSKSIAHRLLICAALADGTSTVTGVTPSDDVLATTDALTALGASIKKHDNDYSVVGCDPKKAVCCDSIYCKDSASTLRFIIPLLAISGNAFTIDVSQRLFERPLDVYEKLFSLHGMMLKKNDGKISLSGPLLPGKYTIDGSISSQFTSGLLFALPLLEGESTVKVTPPFASASYVELTIEALEAFGIRIDRVDNSTFKISGNQRYIPGKFTVPKDYSAAAFIDALNMLGSDIKMPGTEKDSHQGDKAYMDFYPQIKNGTPTINLENCPDLAPILFTLAAYFNGAEFTGTARLKAKESDRAEAMATELRKFGASIDVHHNSVIIRKAQLHAPKELLSGHGDHRVVMALSVLLSVFGGSISDAEAVSKSYPDFFHDIKSVGIDLNLI